MHSTLVRTILACAFVCLVLARPALAAEDDVRAAKKEYKQVQEKLKDKKKQLDKARLEEKRTLTDLHQTNKELVEVSRELKRNREKMRATRREADAVSGEIAALERKIDRSRGWLRRRLLSMHKHGRFGDVLLVLGTSEDFSEAVRRWRYMESLASYERSAIEEFTRDVDKLNSKKKDLEVIYTRLKSETNQVLATEKRLQEERQRKNDILSNIRRRQSNYASVIRDLKNSAVRLQKLIKSYEMASKKPTFGDAGFRNLKGRLPWPVNGRVAIPYGSQKDPLFSTPVFRNGIYIAADEDAPVRASHRGEVVFADWFKGYGQVIIVNHGGGYHTLYANLSEIFLKTGDIIKDRDEIGRVGSSGLLKDPSLYFEIRYKGKPLNPTQWLSRRR